MAATDYVNCDLKNLSFEDLVKSLLTIDDNGCPAIRYIESTDSGTPFINCDNKNVTLADALRGAIELDVNGNPALRLAVTTPAP